MARIIETYKTRLDIGARQGTRERLYTVIECDDDDEAIQLVAATAPSFLGPLSLQKVTAEHVGNDTYEVVVQYGTKEIKDSTYSFDTTGGQTKITQSISTISKTIPGGGTAPDNQGAIGVNADSVEGVEITTPVFKFKESHYLSALTVTTAYKFKLFNLTGKVNSAEFRGFAIGEVAFLGAEGTENSRDDWQINFSFAASPNALNIAVGPSIVVPAKKGWEYLWIRYADAVSNGFLVKQPIAAYVEQVYQYGNFADLGIGVAP